MIIDAIPCSVAIKTTSNNLETGSILELVIVPLTSEFLPDSDILPFSVTIHHSVIDPYLAISSFYFPSHISASNVELNRAAVIGITSHMASELLTNWYSKYIKTKISILTYSTSHITGYLIRWLGLVTYYELFSLHSRDLVSAFMASGDTFSISEYNNQNLTFMTMCRATGINTDHYTDCMSIAVATARIYHQNRTAPIRWWKD